MQKTDMLTRALPALTLPLLLLIFMSCNSSGDFKVGPSDSPFSVNGVIVTDAFLNQTTVAARVLRDGAFDSSLVVIFAGDTLLFDAAAFPFDSVYSYTVDSVNHYPSGSHLLTVASGSQTVNLPILVPGTLAIDTINPPTPPGMTGPEDVNIEWFATPFVSGYVMAATKANETYMNDGHSEYAGIAGTFGTLLQSTFFVDTSVINPVLDTGLWYISVYGYRGAPDKELADQFLPVPFPTQLPNNIDTLQTSGAFGTITVSPFEILQVSTQ